MRTRIGINGFGRIGRLTLRALLRRTSDAAPVVAVNDVIEPSAAARLFKYDTNYGPYPGPVEAQRSTLLVDGRGIKMFGEAAPASIPWLEEGVDLVLECSGKFTDAKRASGHLEAGAATVIISAPATHEDVTIVMGVNEREYDPGQHRIISAASCTTNGLAPVALVLHEEFGIDKGMLSTVHAYTNSQRLLDAAAVEARDARAAPLNIVPSETGAAQALELVIPSLRGRFTGLAFYVPVATVSVIDFTAVLKTAVDITRVNEAMRRWSSERLRGILGYTDTPLVSSDLRGSEYSAVLSACDTRVVADTMVKVIAWYDNEWGYACRLADLALLVASRRNGLSEA
ncbi:MAG TPA: type I glyceraldehyde-3-phosphate dehydrogenase [bacterium]|nr:type I glyceraldehyde-3-phosphate dehydrogenase [bacterium]